jgi:transposase
VGKSGRDMLDALVSGTTDPVALADLGRGHLRKKAPALREALVGRFDAEHALIVGQILAHIDSSTRRSSGCRRRSRSRSPPSPASVTC